MALTLPKGMDHLRARRVWMTWVVMSRTRKDGAVTPPTKVPHTLAGKWWKSNTPGDDGLGTFDEALRAVEEMRATLKPGTVVGVGFSVRHSEQATLDLDACVREDGSLLPWAEDVARQARALGAYIERTPSGTGLRVIGTAPLSGYQPCKRVWRAEGEGVGGKKPGIEVFNLVSGFNTFSGVGGEGDARADISALVDEIIDRVPLSHAAKERHEATTVLALPSLMPIDRMTAMLDALPCTLVVPGGDNDAAVRVYSWLAFLAGAQWNEARDVVRAWGLSYDGDDGWLDNVLGNIDRGGVKVSHTKEIVAWLRAVADSDDPLMGDNARSVALDNAVWLEAQRPGAVAMDAEGLEQVKPEEAGAPPRNPASERMQANAASVIAGEVCDQLRWIEERGRWAIREGARWRIAHEHDVHQVVMPLFRDIAAAQDTAPRREKVLGLQWMDAVMRLVRRNSRVAAPFALWDADPWLLMTAGGRVVDLRNGTTRDATAADLMLHATSADPVGMSEWRAKGPRFARFLDETFRDEETKRFVQKVFGLSLIGEVLEHVLPVFLGDGRNGKGTLAYAVMHAMGDYAGAVSTEMLLDGAKQHAAVLADLKGLRLGIASEVAKGSKFNVGRVKSLTGGDPIKAQYMRQDWFSFAPSHTLVMLANDLPRFDGDKAMKARLRVIEMLNVPDVMDPHLPGTLRMEAPAVLAWAIEGAVLYGAEGLDMPDAVREATDEIADGADPITAWVRERVEITGEHDDAVTTAALVEDLREWSMQPGEREQRTLPQSGRMIAIRIGLLVQEDRRVRRDIHLGETRRLRGFRGVRLRAEVG